VHDNSGRVPSAEHQGEGASGPRSNPVAVPPSDHYFTDQPTSPSQPSEMTVTLRGREYRFATDAGVFSRQNVDLATRALINALPLPFRGEVLDWGCGYGPIGIVIAAESPAAHVTMAELNPRAADLARQSLKLNGITSARVVAGDAFETLRDQHFDRIVTNPPMHAGKALVRRLFADAAERLQPGGEFWLVIPRKQGSKPLARELEALFAEVRTVTIRGGHRVFCATKAGE